MLVTMLLPPKPRYDPNDSITEFCSTVKTRVKIGGGLWGLDPHWKTDNPHCKRQGKMLGGSGFDPPWA